MDSNDSFERLNLKSDNLVETWNDFRQNFEIYMLAKELHEKPEPVQVAIFMKAAGPDAVKVYNKFNLTKSEKNNLARVIEEFEKYCTVPRRNQLYDTYLFGKRRQMVNEPFDTFVDSVKILVKFCGYENEDRMLRDRIAFGVLDRELQKRYFACEQLDLNEVIEMGRATKDMHVDQTNNQTVSDGRSDEQSTDGNWRIQGYNRLCAYCNLRHPAPGVCPAKGKVCMHCNKLGHYSGACRAKQHHDEQLLADLQALYSNK